MADVDYRMLATDVKEGKPGAMLKLWEAVQRFVAMKARKQIEQYYQYQVYVTLDDLMQSGFIAVVDAAERYVPDPDVKSNETNRYLALLDFTLKTRWRELYGVRSSKRDALQYSDSLDAPAFRDDPESPSIADATPDESAAIAFMDIEYKDFLEYCRRVIGAALDSLPEEQAGAIRLHYLKGMTLDSIAELYHKSSRTAIIATIQRAFYRLTHGSKYRRPLRECLEAFEDFREYNGASRNTGIGAFKHSDMSSTEAGAFIGKNS